MHRTLRRMSTAAEWSLAMVGVALACSMVYSSVVQPLWANATLHPDRAIFAFGVLVAVGAFLFHLRSRTPASKWAACFIAVLCVWSQALAFIAVRVLQGHDMNPDEQLRLLLGALLLLVLGVLWNRALRRSGRPTTQQEG
ncbi:hypothetical protein [Ideonella sp.]|uniref:hypothetical protein n=1 Tax=Ideonella sp. TaxID=1929293 RepID=UPI003BB6DF39